MDNDINVDNTLDRFRYTNVNTADDLIGYIAVGQGYEHCMELYFIHSNEVEIEVKIESKTNFVKMQGFYRSNNITKTFECNILIRAFWSLFIKGNDSTIWSGDVNNDMSRSGKIFYPVDQYYYLFQCFVKILDPEHLNIIGDEKGDIVRKWDFRVIRKSTQLRVKISITVVDIIVPEIKVSPQSLKVIEDEDGLNLMCSTQIYLPQNSLLTWKRNGEFLGSFFHSTTNIIHKGIFGNVNWINDKFIYHQSGVSLNDTGIYECCILIEGYPLKCANASIIVMSPGKTPCVGKNSVFANPFQINHLQSRALLREGTFVIILWNFNISEWKISTRFPQCQRHLVNMELGIERWFGINSHNRNRRGIVEGALGGIGIIGSIANSMDINTLKSDLESAGLVGSKGFKIQRNLNQILEDMVIKTANVMGPSILHLQNITLNLMTSEEHSHIARLCLEIQTEYSTNFKIIAQAFQSGVTPLGILQNLPREYAYARNHTDLWVNKWLGCSQDVCYSSSMIPIAGREQILVPITVLGLPISDTQLLFYKLQYTDFALNKDNLELEQLDLSSCLQFQSKVICLPNQDKSIFHSCYHNHTLCSARIETFEASSELTTLVDKRKVCFQIMKDTERVQTFFSSCTNTENLKRGLYCAEGDLRAINVNGIRTNLSHLSLRNVSVSPTLYNLSQIDEFPWREWVNIIQKDQGLLMALAKELRNAEISFKHEQGNLQEVVHQWSTLTGSSWWHQFKNSISIWGKTSITSAAGNILSHPIVIIFIIIMLCIIYQLFLMFRMKKLYKQIRNEIKKGDDMLQNKLKRRLGFGVANSMTGDNAFGVIRSKSECL
ncbi:uncharacterized protein LOC120941523 [Rana temporaria]|uniref:uncharacterized protein LOC120937688 n=2 Tax=Rana temporaria TaxID=8407 RepID=UPI001AADB09E|nr:uncharacterized protein LOC120937688 [Rana temporaria]XP_040210891.1 uncharacterized protein LOC120941523 [Rana temporaria]